MPPAVWLFGSGFFQPGMPTKRITDHTTIGQTQQGVVERQGAGIAAAPNAGQCIVGAEHLVHPELPAFTTGRTLVTTAVASEDSRPIRFEFSAPSARQVSLVGDFNGWDPSATPLSRRGGSGTWSITLPLATGRHVYAFVVDGGLRADPRAPRAPEDDFGSPNSVILVSGSAR